MTRTTSHPTTVGQRIVWARKRKGISQERLAEMVGTSRRHMVRLEKDVHLPKAPMRERLAEALEQEASFFALDEDDEEAATLPSLEHVLAALIEQAVEKRLATA